METCWELHQGVLGKLHIISETESSRNEGHYLISPAKLLSVVVYVLVDQQCHLFNFLTAYPMHQKYLIIVCKFTWTGATVVLMTLESVAYVTQKLNRFSHSSVSSCTH
jgi:hypothetical protein